jgi:eukaryotic-like serine/threonine-protein kinase
MSPHMSNTVLDERYVRLGRLGGGGMAEVYLVRDELLDREVAFKVPRRRQAASGEFVERFRREARHVAALSHPNIVQVYDAGETSDGTPYMAMEYVSGGTLRDQLLERGTLPARAAATLVLQVAGALSAAHASGVIHRDVKPENVLVSESGDAKVADFGIARATDATAITKTCHVLGTVRYLSPEQAMGREVTPASDLYSLGVLLYEALTGEAPFVAEGPIAVAMKHLTQEPRPLHELEPSVPEALETITRKLLEKRPEERYGSAAALADDLERFLAGDFVPSAEKTARLPVVAHEERPARRARRRKKRRSRVLVAALLTASLAGIAVSVETASGFAEPVSSHPLVAGILSLDKGSEPLGRVLAPSTPPVAAGEGLEVPQRERAEEQARETAPSEERPEQAKAPSSSPPPAQEAAVATRWRPVAPEPAPVAPESVAVPTLVGMSLEEAGAALGEVGLSLGATSYEPSEIMPGGTVLSQQPAPGVGVKPGATVSVTVSSDPPEPPPGTRERAPAPPSAGAFARVGVGPVEPPQVEVPRVEVSRVEVPRVGMTRVVTTTATAETRAPRAEAGQ